jgi:hypothetical protein
MPLRIAAISVRHFSIAFRYRASRRDKPFMEFDFVRTEQTYQKFGLLQLLI